MPVARHSFARPALSRSLLLLAALAVGTLALPGGASAQATAKQCADRWNDMKAKDQTGNQTYREFSTGCMAGTGATPTTSAEKPKATTTAAEKPATQSALPPGSIKQCADRWNELKAKDQTGDQTYREFSQKCLAGAVAAKPAAAEKPSAAEAPAKPKTSVPSAGAKPSAKTAAATEDDDETDREAVTRCNGEWKDQKAAKNLSGAKAWHTFMARCL